MFLKGDDFGTQSETFLHFVKLGWAWPSWWLQNYISPQPFFIGHVFWWITPPLCLIWSANTKYSPSNLYPVNPTAFIRDLGQGSLLFFFFSSNLHLVETVGMPWVNDYVTFEDA